MTASKGNATLKGQVYDALFSDIINGTYPPDYVFTEKFLMEKYQVSRAPIREALISLVTQQVLESVPRQGYRIILPDEQKLRDVTRTRVILEPAFLLQYGHMVGPKELEKLRGICQQYNQLAPDQTLERWRVNCDFHHSLIACFKNQFAADTLERALNIQTIFFMMRARKRYYVDDLHAVVLDYLERGDLEMAAKLLRADIDMLADGVSSPIWNPENQTGLAKGEPADV